MVDVAPRPDGRRERSPATVATLSEDASAATWVVFVAALLGRTVLLVTVSLLLWAALPRAWAWIPTTVVPARWRRRSAPATSSSPCRSTVGT